MEKRFIAMLLCLLFTTQGIVIAQNADCNSKLDQAKTVYEQGNIEEVPEILGDCPLQKSLPKNKRIEALVLVTETYIHLAEMDKADSTFILLLDLSPAYRLDSFSRSVELDRLSKAFRTKPIFNMGINAGVTTTLVRQLESFSTDYNIDDLETPERTFAIGYRAGIDFDFPLGKYFELSTGADFTTRGYRYKDNLVNSKLDDSHQIYGKLEFNESQYWVDVPLLLRFVIPTQKAKPYFYLGGHANFLLRGQLTKIQRNLGEGIIAEKSLPIFDMSTKESSLRVANNYSATAGMGIKLPMGLNYLTFDLQYNYQIYNAVYRKNRYTNELLLYEFTYVDDDFSLSDLAFTIGFSKSVYKPRKKKNSPYQYKATNSEEAKVEQKENREKEAKRQQKAFLKSRKDAEKEAFRQEKQAIERKKEAKEQAKEREKEAKRAKIIKGEKP